jgi:hypothetical protein
MDHQESQQFDGVKGRAVIDLPYVMDLRKNMEGYFGWMIN